MIPVLKQSVGIDMSMDKFDVCFSVIDNQQNVTIKSTRKFANKNQGFKEFDLWVKKLERKDIPLVYVVEATGVYYEQLAWHLFEQDASISVILPTKARKYLESLGLKSKNDKIDAKGLSRLAAEQSLEKWKPLSSDFYKLRALTREIESIHQMKTSLNNQVHALYHSRVQSKSSIRRIKTHISLLDKQLVSIEKEIKKVVNQNHEIKTKIDKIIKVKGLGLMSVVTILAECDGFALMKNQKQLVSYAGYDIVQNQSGKKTGKTRISKKGNSHIRRILHMPAFSVVKYKEPHFVALYERLIAKGKTKMQAYVAIQKKLLVLVYTLWKNDQEYIRTERNTIPKKEESPILITEHGNKIALENPRATQDKLQYNEMPEVLFSLGQRY